MKKRNKKQNDPAEEIESGFAEETAPSDEGEAIEPEPEDGENEQPEAEPEEIAEKPKPERNPDLALAIYSIPILLAGGFAVFAMYSKHTSLPELIAAGVSVVFLCLLILRAIPSIFRFYSSSEPVPPCETLGERSRKRLHPIVKIVLGAIAAQLIAILLVYTTVNIVHGARDTLIGSYKTLFVFPRGELLAGKPAAAVSKLGALSFIIPGNYREFLCGGYLLPAFALNTAAVAACAAVLYELVLRDSDKKTAKFAVLLMLVSPTVILLLQPLGGTSYFLLFALLAFFCCRKEKFLAAGVFAALSCLFNIFGALIAVTVLMEGIHSAVCAKREGEPGIGKTVTCTVLGTVLPLLTAGGAVLIRQLLGKGLSAFTVDPRIAFEPLGRLAGEWLGGGRRLAVLVSLVLLVLLAVVTLLSIKKARSSYSVFGILYLALAPSLTPAELTAFAVFAFPLLAPYVSGMFSRRYARRIVLACAFAISVINVAVFYVS
ncbi:MAG: hypothetical protein IJM20_04505 [Clostridia bacterium]|nr:hypothetical protein [Clostridia bacterium]